MVAATFVPVTTRKRQVADIIYSHTITMISTLLLACLAASAAAKAADPSLHAYATPTPDVLAAHKQVPIQQIVANLSAEATPESTPITDAAHVEVNESTDEEDIQTVLKRNPLVQIARHVSFGMLDPERDPPYMCRNAYSIEIMQRDPLVIYIRDFLQPGEAEHMIAASVPAMARSMVAALPNDNQTAMQNKKDEQRTSSSAFMARSQDVVMECIEQRAADFVGIDREQLEGLQVVWYRIGQQYRPHFDYFAKNTDYHAAYTANGGQRTYTWFVYLNDATYSTETGERIELEGGATSFPKLGISVQPRRGDAVFWTNMQIDGEEDERVLHGGDPVVAGQKMGMNIWARERAFSA